ncbi:MAG: hypothetical protein WBP10_17870 [Thermoanaerobaculia bacterium]|jgi:hypothetical protein
MRRGGNGSIALLSLAALFLALQSCGRRSSPTAPPLPLPSADIVPLGEMQLGCRRGECEYRVEFRNDGPGCADTVWGSVRLYEGDELLASRQWALDAPMVIHSGESFTVESCCLLRQDLEQSDSYETEAFWNDVRCP